jgi:hypothetical protein
MTPSGVRLVLAMTLASVTGFALSAGAVDHNNMEPGRPLSFDDAYSLAHGEMAVEVGFGWNDGPNRDGMLGAAFEYQYGFARNQDVSVEIEPDWTSGEGVALQDMTFSYFRSFRREVNGSPAVGGRLSIDAPVDREGSAIVSARLALTRALGQYPKLHLNFDGTVPLDPDDHERSVVVGGIVGLSAPIGFPRRFDQSLVAEFAVEQSMHRDGGVTGRLGAGLRRQVTPRAVLDVGVDVEVLESGDEKAGTIAVRAGYSVGF